MNRRATRASLLLAAAVLAAGCGSQSSPGAAPASQVTPPSLATSLVTVTGTWAAAVMGGTAASHNNFWQLFVRPAGASTWRLATPPGVASNGGFVLAGAASGSLLAGFRPSQRLSYSPLAVTSDNGQSWSPGLLDAGLADVPGALAADPASGRRLALLTSGAIDMSAPGGTGWARLATRQALASSAAGARCGLVSLTSVTFSKTGAAMLGASCAHSPMAGVYRYAGGTWRQAGPALPAAYSRQPSTVLRLGTAGGITTALLAAGTGRTAALLAAWSADGGAHWVLSAPFRLDGATLASASSGPGNAMAVVLSGGRAAVIAGPRRSWQALPRLPAGTTVLASGPAAGWAALAVHRTTLTVWQAAPGSGRWTTGQVIKVPVPFGSSG